MSEGDHIILSTPDVKTPHVPQILSLLDSYMRGRHDCRALGSG